MRLSDMGELEKNLVSTFNLPFTLTTSKNFRYTSSSDFLDRSNTQQAQAKYVCMLNAMYIPSQLAQQGRCCVCHSYRNLEHLLLAAQQQQLRQLRRLQQVGKQSCRRSLHAACRA
jgi:hypothetical protein